MYVGSSPSNQLMNFTSGMAGIAMVFLDKDVLNLIDVARAAILRVHVAPALSFEDERNGQFFQIENHETPWLVLGIPVAEEA